MYITKQLINLYIYIYILNMGCGVSKEDLLVEIYPKKGILGNSIIKIEDQINSITYMYNGMKQRGVINGWGRGQIQTEKIIRSGFWLENKLIIGEIREDVNKCHSIHYEGEFNRERRSGLGAEWTMRGSKSLDQGNPYIRWGPRKASQIYLGAWKSGARHGYGVEIGENYEFRGFWANGKREGPGILCRHLKDIEIKFKANFSKGVFHGKAVKWVERAGAPKSIEYAMYEDGGISLASELYISRLKETPDAFSKDSLRGTGSNILYQEEENADLYHHTVQVLVDAFTRKPLFISQVDIRDKIHLKFNDIKTLKLPKQIIRYADNTHYTITKSIFQNGKLKLKIQKLNVVGREGNNQNIVIEGNNAGINNHNPDRSRDEFYGKAQIINNDEFYKFNLYEMKILDIIKKSSQDLCKFIPKCIEHRLYNIRMSYGLVLESYNSAKHKDELELANSEEIKNFSSKYRVMHILSMEYLNKENNLMNWLYEGSYINTQIAKVLINKILTLYKYFETYNLFHGKINPKYIFSFHNSHTQTFDLVITNLTYAKILKNGRIISRHVAYEEQGLEVGKLTGLECLDVFSPNISSDCYTCAFYPFDYYTDELLYLPFNLRRVVNFPFDPKLLTRHNVVQTDIFSLGVIITQIMLAAVNKYEPLNYIQVHALSDLPQFKNAWEQIVAVEGEFALLLPILDSIFTQKYKFFKDIPDLFVDAVYRGWRYKVEI